MNQDSSNLNLFIKILALPKDKSYISIVFPSLMWKFVNKAIYDEDINKLSQSELYKVYEYQMNLRFTRSLLSAKLQFIQYQKCTKN